jgi:hypothetical protein
MDPHNERRWYAFPVLVATYPAVFVSSLYPGRLTGHEIAIGLLVPLAAAAVIYALGAAVLRRLGVPPSARALAAGAVTAWLACGMLVADRMPFVRQRVALALCALLAAGAAATLVRRRRAMPSAARAAEVFTAVLIVFAAAQTFWRQQSAERAAGRVRDRLGWDTLPAVRAVAPGTERPDIYLLVLDNFANADVMRGVHAHSLDPFVDTLRALGFVVPRTRSNYAWTAQSLGAMLNLGHIAEVAPRTDGPPMRADPLVRLVEDNRSFRLLKQQGYTIYLAPSTHFAGTYLRGTADEDVLPPGVSFLRAALAKSSALEAALVATVPGRLMALRAGRTLADSRMDVDQFAAAAAVARRPGPKLVVLHTLLSHSPYSVDAACRPVRGGSSYVDAARCVERATLGLVRAVVRDSRRPAVIVIQGDHGSAPGALGLGTTLGELSPEALAERFGAFGAYRLPDSGGGLAAADGATVVTPINVMREIFSRYLGADLPPLPNTAHFAPYERPFELQALDTLALDAGIRALRPHGH